MTISLKNVTLLALGSTQIEGNIKALQHSKAGIDFGAVKFVTSAVTAANHYANGEVEIVECLPIRSINAWNYEIIYSLAGYIDTDYAILVHHDGYIINPHLWRDEWLQYDYCGSPWPLPTDNYSYRSESGQIQRVGNSVSLRSKKLMNLVSTREWRYYYGNCNEDGFICCHNREWLESEGCKFAPFEEAIYFGKEVELPENKDVSTFLFHTHG